MSVGNEKIRDLIIFWGKLRHHSTPKFLRQNELDVGQRMRRVGMMLTDQKIVVVMPRFSLPSQGNYTALTRA